MFCKYCGAELPDGSKFCQFCGMKLDGPEYVQDTKPVQAEEPAVQDIPEPIPAPAPVPAPAPAPEPTPAPQQEIYRQPAQEQPAYTQPQQTYAQPQPAPEQPKKKSKKGLIIGLIAGGAGLLILILLFLLLILPRIIEGKKVEIDFRNYAKLQCEGYDTLGTAEADFDWDALAADYGEDLKISKKYKSYAGSQTPIDALKDFVYYYADYENYGHLSNGDTVNYTLSVYPDLGDLINVVVKDADQYDENGEIIIPLTVEGLEEAELFDPFENIEVTVTGYSPFGRLEYNFDNAPAPSQAYQYAFSADKEYDDLANGDVVTFTIPEYYSDDFIEDYGMIPSRTSFEYTVEGLPELVTDVSQIDSEEMEYIKTVVKNIYFNDHISYDSDAISTNSYDVIGTILRVSKDPSYYAWDNNSLFCVVEQNCTVSQEGAASENYTIYGVIYFNNVLVDKDGLVNINEDDYDEDYNSYSIDVGNWTISGSYGYPTVDDIRTKYINASDAYYTYQDNITK